MNKTKIRVIILLVVIILSWSAFFAVLFAEENKRLAKNAADRERFLEEARAADQARKEYLDSIVGSRAASRQAMEDAKKQYEDLLKEQPNIVQQNTKQATTTVKQLVPVANTSSVQSTQKSKPSSTRSTKTS